MAKPKPAKKLVKSAVKPVKKGRRKEPEGEHIRQLAPASAVKAFIIEVIATKTATSEAGQELGTATKRAHEQGVNIPAARIVARLYSKAKQDSMKARVLWEDVVYYLTECTDFDRIAPSGMFTAEESGQKHSKQTEIPLEPETVEIEKIDVIH